MLCILFLVCSLQVERNVVVSNSEDVSGSGVVLETGLVLTNAHLVGMETYVGDNVVQVLKVDTEHDLALLKVATKHFGKVKFAKVKQGQAVYYVGNPGQFTGVVSRGFVILLDKEHLFTDTLPIPGMSGGGLYDSRNRLVGLDEGYIITSVGVHIAVHIQIEVIRDFLKGAT